MRRKRRSLLTLLRQFAGGDYQIGEVMKTTELPLCDPAPVIEVSGRSFCVTGTFALGNRAQVSAKITYHGGLVSKDITKNTDYLVLGTYVSQAWKHEILVEKLKRPWIFEKNTAPQHCLRKTLARGCAGSVNIMRETLRRIVEENNTPMGRLFDMVVQLLVVVSVVSFTVGTLPTLSAETQAFLVTLEWVTVILFSAEYVLRLMVAKSPFKYAFSFFGLVDIVAILPFYLSIGIDLRAIRVIRFLRIFRLMKLARYSRAIGRMGLALRLAREELFLFLAASILMIYLASVGIYYFERAAQPEAFASVPHAMWWAVVTLTTVGYGDLYPVTTGGKMFTFFILLVGLGLVAVPAGIVSSALAKARELEAEDT